MMKQFLLGGGLFQGDSTPIHCVRGLTEWFDKDKNGLNHVL